jgi:redox-sensitive bicupin YhaK (pirin superfamily)
MSRELIELAIAGRPRDLGGFFVQRLLPSPERRLVGPFIFFDHMGPAQLPAGTGMDVRPHPHIGLATVTYLFQGEIVHRDSLGSHQVIRPGELNWMVAGRGIVHSERTSPERRQQAHALHGIQAWVALPVGQEEAAPSFRHHAASELPEHVFEGGGGRVRLIAGTGFGLRSPASVSSPTLFADLQLSAAADFDFPDEHAERALYVVTGRVRVGDQSFGSGSMLVLRPGTTVDVHAEEETRAMLLGGEHLPGTREIFWNFVSSSADRIERAKRDWSEGRFPKVPGDEHEFTPLPT